MPSKCIGFRLNDASRSSRLFAVAQHGVHGEVVIRTFASEQEGPGFRTITFCSSESEHAACMCLRFDRKTPDLHLCSSTLSKICLTFAFKFNGNTLYLNLCVVIACFRVWTLSSPYRRENTLPEIVCVCVRVCSLHLSGCVYRAHVGVRGCFSITDSC